MNKINVVLQILKKFIILNIVLSIILIVSSLSLALTCEYVETSLCLNTTILKLDGGNELYSNNSHAELWNYTSPGYPLALCCSSANQELIVDCNVNTSVEIFRLTSQTNSHVQFSSDYNNLMAQWKFDNNFLEDIGGFHVTNDGATFVNDRKENINSAIRLDGSDEIVAGIDNFILNNSQSFSASLWFRVNDVPSDGNVMGIIGRTSGGRWGIDYYFEGNQIRAGTRGGSQYIVTAPFSSLNHSTWHHVVFTYEPENELVLYLNGNRVASRSTVGISWQIGDDLVHMGTLNAALGGTPRNLIGDIDDVKIYDKSLSQDEVNLLYIDGLIGHWIFDGDILDYSGNQNNGTNNNASWTSNRYGSENKAMYFDDTLNAHVSIPGITFQDENPWTFSHWINWDGQTDQYVFYAGSGASTRNFIIRYSNNNRFSFRSGTTDYALFPAGSSNNIIGKWTHLVWMADGTGNLALYVNNEHIGNLTGVGTRVVFATFGRGYSARTYESFPNNTYYLRGALDDINIFNRVITEQEINTLFIDGKSKYEYPVCIGGEGNSDCLATYGTCPIDYACMGSIASSEGWDYTNAHIAECNYYELNVCCAVSSPPDVPQLIYPENNDSFFINRTPTFNWTQVSTAVEYQIMLAEDIEFNSLIFNETVINNNYTRLEPLEFGLYYWRVRAFNGELYGQWSNISNFTLVTNVLIELLTETVDFGSLISQEQMNTTENDPEPFKFKNSGNIEADLKNITVQAPIWSSTLGILDTNYWMIRARTFESFNASESITDWINVSSTINNLIKSLNYTGEREVQVDIAIEVPIDEPPGTKSANMDFLWGVAS